MLFLIVPFVHAFQFLLIHRSFSGLSLLPGNISVFATFGATRDLSMLKRKDFGLSNISNSESPILVNLSQPNNSAVGFCHHDSSNNSVRWRCGLNDVAAAGEDRKDEKRTVIVAVRGYTSRGAPPATSAPS